MCSKKTRIGLSTAIGLGLISLCFLSGIGCKRQPTVLPGSNEKAAAADGQQSFDFVDVTARSGVHAAYENSEEAREYSIVESLGGGVGAFDFDRDGRIDLMFPGGGTIKRDQPLSGLPTSLWWNLEQARFVDISATARVTTPPNYSHGCAAADFDNDGFCDVLITGYGGVQLLRNQGDGTLVDATAQSTIADSSWSSSAAWGDLNEDGNVDLYIAHYVNWSWSNHPQCPTAVPGVLDVCTPNDFSGLPDEVYLSNGDGTFRAAGKELGLDTGGKGLGVAMADLNGDMHIDIYVANDTTSNFLYLNDGSGKLEEIGLISGTALDGTGTPNGSMGIAVLDYDLNLMPDLWVTNYENETYALYENSGDARFLWATERAGLNALGNLFVGFGTVAADLDCDGDEDIAVANGHVMLHPSQSITEQQAVLLANTVSGKSRRLVRQNFGEENYFSKYHRGRGLISCDIDGDADLDLVFSNVRDPAAVLLNNSQTDGKQVHLQLVGSRANRDAIGARVVMTTNASKTMRVVVGGGSYLSQGPYTLSWGLPAGEQIVAFDIVWPDGSTQNITQVDTSKPMLVVQPKSES